MSDEELDNVIGHLEFAARAYEVATTHLIEQLALAGDEAPQRILNALMVLVTAINDEWP